MKAKILAEQLMLNPDYDILFSAFISPKCNKDFVTFDNICIEDIGYSDKVIVLSGDET